MSNIAVEAIPWSFSSKAWKNSPETNLPYSAVYAVKREVHPGVYQYGGMACCVLINDGKSEEKMCFVTSSDVVAHLKADKKQTEMHPFLKKKMKDRHLLVNSAVNSFGPFSFLLMDPQSSPGLKIKPELTCLDFQVPKQERVSEFEAHTFIGTNILKLKFAYQEATGKYILSTTKDQLELPFVLGAPIIIENKDVSSKISSSRWPVVGVMGLDEEFELCPHFVTVDIFGQGNTASGSEGSANTDGRPVQCEELNGTATELVHRASGSRLRDTLSHLASASGHTDYSVQITNAEDETPVPCNRLSTTVADRQRKAGVPSDDDLLNLSAELGSKWKMLSSALRTPIPKIEAIDHENKQMVEKCYVSLMSWKERTGRTATYEVLEAGLCHDTVDGRKLAEKYCYERIMPQEHDGRG